MHNPMEIRRPDVPPWHSAFGPWVNHSFCEGHSVGKLIGTYHSDEQMHIKDTHRKNHPIKIQLCTLTKQRFT